MADNKSNAAWKNLIDKYDIVNHVQHSGEFEISASQIKEFREPRLMAKWDSSEDLPSVLKSNKLNILPVSRSTYCVSDYRLYQILPVISSERIQYVPTREYESIDFDNLTSESNAINAMTITGILDDFLDAPAGSTVETFNGRMGTGAFSFSVDNLHGGQSKVHVNNAQLEIDGGFENDNSVIIMEAKNVPHPDFHVRQLYFPYRLWLTKVKKPIRLVFSQYVDSIYHLYEYEFADPYNYSSIRLLQRRDYTFQASAITWDDLREIWERTSPVTDDNQDEAEVPFPQANNFKNVITLMQRLSQVENMNAGEIADYMEFDPRQSSYYAAAGEYLGVFDRTPSDGVSLSHEGKRIMTFRVKERRLALVELMFKHEIFHYFFGIMYGKGNLPTQSEIEDVMRLHNICNSVSTLPRRASSVLGWLRWISSLVDE